MKLIIIVLVVLLACSTGYCQGCGQYGYTECNTCGKISYPTEDEAMDCAMYFAKRFNKHQEFYYSTRCSGRHSSVFHITTATQYTPSSYVNVRNQRTGNIVAKYDTVTQQWKLLY